jgi:hypothetical protein
MNPTDKRVKYGAKRTVWLRNYQRARGRALARLAQEYPDQYREYLEEERAKDETEGKAWLDISGRTRANSAMDRAESYTNSVSRKQADGNQQAEGDLGGEE